MKIGKRIAKEIVLKLSDTIGQNINIMDTNGVIIASSDANREGKLHGGALKLIKENLTEVIVESNEQFPGSKNGINLPVLFEGDVVGVIGITGDVSEVYKYGEIIKKMTEILLLEERAKELNVMEQKARDRFFNEWLVDSLEIKSPARFEQFAADMSVDTSLSYRVAALAPAANLSPDVDTLTEISRRIRRSVSRALKADAFRTASHMILIFPDTKDEIIEKALGDVKAHIQSSFSCEIKIGVSDKGAVLHLSDAHERAVKALEFSMKSGLSRAVSFYNPYDINYLLNGLDDKAKEAFLSDLFKDTTQEDKKSAMEFASIYLQENGSLDKIAERLFVHKNTVKYRINKLTQLTGVDIRTCLGTYIFMLSKMMTE